MHFLKNSNENKFNKNEFTIILQLNGMHGFSINNNGEAIINELTTRCTTKVNSLKAQYPGIDIEADKAHFQTLGIIPSNTYLFVRRHDSFNLIVKY